MGSALEHGNVVSLESFLSGTLHEINETFSKLQSAEQDLQQLRSVVRVRLAALQAAEQMDNDELAAEFAAMQAHPETAQTPEAFVAGLRERLATS